MSQSELLTRGMTRRGALRCLGAGVVVLAGCGGSDSSGEELASSDGQQDLAGCAVIPAESSGSFAADGSDTVNVLSNSAVFRSDIRSDFGGDNTQDGALMTLDISVLDGADGCSPLAGAAVYLWQCNARGEYSAYAARDQDDQRSASFLRGVQVADDNGQLRFTTIYPGRISERATHLYVRVYRDDSLNQNLTTTQLAFDDAVSEEVYASSVSYERSASRAATANQQDSVFGDGYAEQLLSLSGDPARGYVASIAIAVDTMS